MAKSRISVSVMIIGSSGLHVGIFSLLSIFFHIPFVYAQRLRVTRLRPRPLARENSAIADVIIYL
jgi:hypothetical protein